ncbi:hypothetical protein [Peribacillus simplex]|uniref:hypothetical protein n=1 Tax=Peribacillus simplex TaxID=1478 RepID=UPI0024C1C816|nr:hypothetical protein [Peribacillus simplex]WHY56493.1 hypothetical protein QNH43_25935 [Peribacillus simplex]
MRIARGISYVEGMAHGFALNANYPVKSTYPGVTRLFLSIRLDHNESAGGGFFKHFLCIQCNENLAIIESDKQWCE